MSLSTRVMRRKSWMARFKLASASVECSVTTIARRNDILGSAWRARPVRAESRICPKSDGTGLTCAPYRLRFGNQRGVKSKFPKGKHVVRIFSPYGHSCWMTMTVVIQSWLKDSQHRNWRSWEPASCRLTPRHYARLVPIQSRYGATRYRPRLRPPKSFANTVRRS